MSEVGPTARLFWQHWRDEHRHWTILSQDNAFVATDAARPKENPIAAEVSSLIFEDKTSAHTHIALRCTQYALEQIGVA